MVLPSPRSHWNSPEIDNMHALVGFLAGTLISTVSSLSFKSWPLDLDQALQNKSLNRRGME
jgi:hypothetical protein